MKCEAILSYIQADLFNRCLTDCWKVPSAVLVFKNVREMSVGKHYHLMCLCSDFSKTFEELGLLITIMKSAICSSTDLLTIVADRTASAFNMSMVS